MKFYLHMKSDLSHQFTILNKKPILEVKLAGQRTREVVVAAAKKLIKMAHRAGIPDILVDIKDLRGHLKIGEIVEVVTIDFPSLRPLLEVDPPTRIALVDRPIIAKVTKLFEKAMKKEGYHLRVFSQMAKARSWLKSKRR